MFLFGMHLSRLLWNIEKSNVCFHNDFTFLGFCFNPLLSLPLILPRCPSQSSSFPQRGRSSNQQNCLPPSSHSLSAVPWWSTPWAAWSTSSSSSPPTPSSCRWPSSSGGRWTLWGRRKGQMERESRLVGSKSRPGLGSKNSYMTDIWGTENFPFLTTKRILFFIPVLYKLVCNTPWMCCWKILNFVHLIISLAVLPLLFCPLPNLISDKTLAWEIRNMKKLPIWPILLSCKHFHVVLFSKCLTIQGKLTF